MYSAPEVRTLYIVHAASGPIWTLSKGRADKLAKQHSDARDRMPAQVGIIPALCVDIKDSVSPYAVQSTLYYLPANITITP